MKKIILECPVCGTSKIQKIPDSILSMRDRFEKGICGVLIPSNTICAHSFLIEVDKNFTIRDVITIEDIKKHNSIKMININKIEEVVKSLKSNTINRILAGL